MRPLRAVWRLVCVLVQVLSGLFVLAVRFPRASEAQRHGFIQRWSAGTLRALGLRLQVQHGHPAQPAPPACLVVLNHVSWLDILCVHAVLPQARFVSKADVHGWPVIGWMVAAAGTLFIERERKRDALRVVHHCAEALRAGQTVAIFPEGTTGDGPQMLPFHANLLQAAISAAVPVQPLALRYSAPGERFASAAPYVGEMNLIQSLWRIASARGLTADLAVLPLMPTEGTERRALAEAARAAIQAAL